MQVELNDAQSQIKSFKEEIDSSRKQLEQVQNQFDSQKKKDQAELTKLRDELKETLDSYNTLLQQQKQRDQQPRNMISVAPPWRSPQAPASPFANSSFRHNSLTSGRADLQSYYDEQASRRPSVVAAKSRSSTDVSSIDSKYGALSQNFSRHDDSIIEGKLSIPGSRHSSSYKHQSSNNSPYYEHNADSTNNNSGSNISLSNPALTGSLAGNGSISMGVSLSSESIAEIPGYNEPDLGSPHDFQVPHPPFSEISDGFRSNSSSSHNINRGLDSREQSGVAETPTMDNFLHRFEDSSTVDGGASVTGAPTMGMSASAGGHNGNGSVGGHTSAAGAGGPGASIQLVGRMSRTIRTLESELSSVKMDLARATNREEEATKEVLRLVSEGQELQKIKESSDKMSQRIEELEKREKVALEMLGEKAERVEELKADVEDMKEMYRTQIEELIEQLAKAMKK